MAWRAPRYGLVHALRAAGDANVTVSSEDPGFPKVNLLDDLQGTLFKSNAGGTETITVDRGSGTPLDIGRVMIPAGWSGVLAGWTLEADDDPGFGSPVTLIASGILPNQAAGPRPISQDFDAGQTDKSQFVRFTNGGAGNIELPQLILTDILSPSRGPEQEWSTEVLETATHTQKASGARTSVLQGPDREQWSLAYRRVLEATDLLDLDRLVAHGTVLPFVFDPPYDDEDAILAKLLRREYANDHPNPAGVEGKRRRYDFDLVEYTG